MVLVLAIKVVRIIHFEYVVAHAFQRAKTKIMVCQTVILQGSCGYRAFLLTIVEEVRKYLVIGRKKSFGSSEYYVRQHVSRRHRGYWLR